jgi:hypothetical protein
VGRVDLPARYVRLCLRLDRHVDGLVDAYFGPPDWKREASDEEPVEPARLLAEAAALLDALDGSELEDERRRWLRGQLQALECLAERLCGTEMAWADEVERCFGVRPTRTEDDVFAAAHRRLDTVLPGTGDVRDRFVAWNERTTVPREKLVAALEHLTGVLGARAHDLARMPEEEIVAYELVSGVPWIAFNRYEGDYASRVEVNTDLPVSLVLIVDLAAHESYPGHHTERVLKDAHLYRSQGRVETSVAISMAPEAIVTEGIATNALAEAFGETPFGAVADVLAAVGLEFDAAEADAIHRADVALGAAATNAAFMLHEDGLPVAEAEEYLRTWGLGADERAAQAVSFILDPETRTYVSTYDDGRRLCRAFADAAPGNFTRLLTEQLTVADLAAPG